MISVVEELFPNVTVKGCLFHHRQAIFRNVQKHHCIEVLNNVTDFEKILHYLYSLAFVPKNKIQEIYNNTIKKMINEASYQWTGEGGYQEEVKRFVAYVEFTWIGPQSRRGGHRAPMFQHSLWNKFDDIISENYQLTNNSLEAMNSSWAPTIPRNASVWTVIGKFQKEESNARLTHSEALRGVVESHNRSRSEQQKKKMDELHNLCVNFDKSEICQYLENVMHLFN